MRQRPFRGGAQVQNEITRDKMLRRDESKSAVRLCCGVKSKATKAKICCIEGDQLAQRRGREIGQNRNSHLRLQPTNHPNNRPQNPIFGTAAHPVGQIGKQRPQGWSRPAKATAIAHQTHHRGTD